MNHQELQVLDPDQKPFGDYRSNVDTSRPFRSVKEAVAIFGERFLVGEIYSPKPPFMLPKKEAPFFSPSPMRVCNKEPSLKSSSGNSCLDQVYEKFTDQSGSSYNSQDMLSETVKKLEVELEETKAELKLLKERESETEVALATLNAELHKNMSKLALAEADVAGKAVLALRSVSIGGGDVVREEEKKKDDFMWSKSTSLAEILSLGDKEGLFVGKKLKERKLVMKKKPIIPLVADLFWKKKGSSSALHNPLYASPLQWN